MTAIPIIFQHRLAALADEHGVVLADHIEVLEPDHPLRRFVCALAGHAHDVTLGLIATYEHDEAHAAARERLLPVQHAGLLAAGFSDAQLAEICAMPLEQISARRHELAAEAPVRPTPARPARVQFSRHWPATASPSWLTRRLRTAARS